MLPVKLGDIGDAKGIPTVGGRKIWEWLGIKSPFSDWVKYQIETLHLIEDRDYICFQENLKASGIKHGGAQYLIEYHFTLHIATHLRMASRTKRGWEAREYFIDIEKRYLAGDRREKMAHQDLAPRQIAPTRGLLRRTQACATYKALSEVTVV